MTPPAAAPADVPPRPARTRRRFDRGAFYRLCRMLHAYLSAFAFLALIFFSATGLLLDHPDWMRGRKPGERDAVVRLPPAELATARAAPEPGRALAAATARHVRLLGAYKDSQVEDGSSLVRLEGARGSTDLDVDLATGVVRVAVQGSAAVDVLGELHRGRAAGEAWRRVIDVSAVLILALSLVGYVLFFSLRFRLRTSLLLTAASLAVLVLVYRLTVP